jgi:diguanylate cyclase (GGDEF)-like protein
MYKENSNLIDNNVSDPAYIDLITGLKNRDYIARMLPRVIRDKGDSNYSAILIDLDNFKTINYVFSYEFGDNVLNKVGKILADTSNNKSIIIYSGADKFIIIAFEEENIEQYVVKMLTDLKITLIIEDVHVNLTASIGIYTNTNGGDVYTAIQNADIALSYAKNQGKDCFSIFNSSMKQNIFRKSKMQKKLKDAIENDLLEVYYQPKINLKDEKLIGTEALLRWKDDELGTISPSEFIPIAEETGIIIELGRYVLKKVCIQIKNWKLSDVDYINVAVNVSAKQFRDTLLPEYISNILKEYELPTSVLELEVTESAIIENIKYTNKTLNEFIKKDIKIAIDDFGTGYSSYNHLSDLSLNTLKIDKSFIDFINCDLKKDLIVKNIIDLAHILDMKVVAEGVEQEHQMKTLKDYGCDIIQGYYYSKPLSNKDFEKYVMKRKGEI